MAVLSGGRFCVLNRAGRCILENSRHGGLLEPDSAN